MKCAEVVRERMMYSTAICIQLLTILQLVCIIIGNYSTQHACRTQHTILVEQHSDTNNTNRYTHRNIQ